MKTPYSVFEAAKSRYSARTFTKESLSQETRQKILDFARNIPVLTAENQPVRIEFIEKATSENGEKLGTYGVIKNASLFLGVASKAQPLAEENLGYQFEQLVLYITSLGLGTCWLGGTFNRGAFAEAMKVQEDEIFPIISPVGHIAGKKRLFEKLMRSRIKADTRLPWENLFFKGDFSQPLSESESGECREILDCVRIAPSAVNKQPWRIVVSEDGSFHFFENRNLQHAGNYDIQKIDMGIALAHFQLAAEKKGMNGHFTKTAVGIALPENTEYIISWVKD